MVTSPLCHCDISCQDPGNNSVIPVVCTLRHCILGISRYFNTCIFRILWCVPLCYTHLHNISICSELCCLQPISIFHGSFSAFLCMKRLNLYVKVALKSMKVLKTNASVNFIILGSILFAHWAFSAWSWIIFTICLHCIILFVVCDWHNKFQNCWRFCFGARKPHV